MFEVGSIYLITKFEGGEVSYSSYKVVEYDHPLLKVSQPHGETIFNVTSPYFASAVPQADE